MQTSKNGGNGQNWILRDICLQKTFLVALVVIADLNINVVFAGGVIELIANSLLMDGELRVSGGDSEGPRGGGGAGGSVYIQVKLKKRFI